MTHDPAHAGGESPAPPSFGNMGPHHWSRAREGTNEEAMAYLRERSGAPGVAEGGAERNHYCMRCDGVIPFDPNGTACPHCGEPIEGAARRYFNWVEIDKPPASDASAVLTVLAILGVALVGVGYLLWRIAR